MAKSREAFRTISEVAEWLDVQTHVLRFWESKFSQVKPVKRAGGRRYYRPQDMELLGGLKKLLHEDGMPIKDAQQLLREKGVKHVASLSRPVDEEDASSVADDVVEEVAQEPVNTPEETPQTETAPEDVLNDASEAAVSVDAIAEDQDPEPVAEVVSKEQEANALPSDMENGIEELPEELLATASENEESQAAETPASDDTSDDIPEDLLVKIEDDIPPASTDQGTVLSEPESAVPASRSSQHAHDDGAALEQSFAGEVTAPSSPSDDLPPMNDLFAALETSDKPSQPQDRNVPPAAVEDIAHEEPTAEPFTDTSAAAQDNSQAAPSNTDADADAALAPLDAQSEEIAPPSESFSAQNTPVVNAPAAAPTGQTTTAQQQSAQGDEASATPPVSSSNSDDPQTAVAREDARDDFLLMLTKPVTVSSQDASRAASLLARLEALQSKAG
jgi:DNA-binding transcriptional MerR regulator